MTPDEVIVFAQRLPPALTRVEMPIMSPDGRAVVATLVIEQASPHIVRAVPEIGDVEKAAKAKEAQRPSDVESLGHIPPAFREE